MTTAEQKLQLKLKMNNYSTQEIAEILGLTSRTLMRLYDDNKIEGFLLPPKKRTRRIPRSSVEKFLVENGFPCEVFPLGGFVSCTEASKLTNEMWSAGVIRNAFDRGELIGYKIPVGNENQGDRRIYLPYFIEHLKETNPEYKILDCLPAEKLKALGLFAVQAD